MKVRVKLDFNTVWHVVVIIFLVITLVILTVFPLSKKEGMDNLEDIISPMFSFCSTHLGQADTLNNSCSKLTKSNCKKTSCCVLVDDHNCVAGGKAGPTFTSDSDGTDIKMGSYEHGGVCHGPFCKLN